MPRSYNARAIALTIGRTAKWVDNLLSHHALPGVTGGRQGVQRVISDDGLLAVEITRLLVVEIGVPLDRAAALVRAAFAVRSADDMQVTTDSGLVLTFQLPTIERRLRDRMTEAMESVGHVRRGRPPRMAATS
ncbi:MAG TPA: hypothetical protein VFT29_13050 [Gemmatimonadaceae bacterium]|nr:hypothetical protein [Gemmatimonadaceae bacterium]